MAVSADDFDILTAIYYVARVTAMKFKIVEREDVAQELYLYTLDGGKDHIEKALEEGDTNKVFRALFGAARRYVEDQRIEAAHGGWEPQDIVWYDAAQVAQLVPAALSESFEGAPVVEQDGERPRTRRPYNEGGSLAASILDVRRALEHCPAAAHILRSGVDPHSKEGRDACLELVEYLGGSHPMAPGYKGRRAVSNAAAQAWTDRGLGGEPHESVEPWADLL